jgi:stearoyl-CoA desaturase (delta-9 desaturase)
MTATTAARPSDAPAVQYDAGSTRAPWNQPEADSTTESDLRQSMSERVILGVFIALPFMAMVAAIPVAAVYGWISWLDVGLAVVMYAISGHGITVGFHRYFTHGSFKAKRPLRVALAIAGSLAIEGPVNTWVADHRKHHKFSDKDGDPHSPWRFGTSTSAGCSTWSRPTSASTSPTCCGTRTSAASPAPSPGWSPCRCCSRRWSVGW